MPASPQTGGSCVRSASFRRDNSLNTVLIRGHLPLSSRSAPFGALGCSYPQPQVRLLGTAASLNARPSSPPQPPFDWIGLEEEKKIWGDFESNGEAVLVQDLRSDHAGETGAVYIYAGAQAAMKWGGGGRFSAGSRAFVQTHHATESEHLAYFERLLDPGMKSKLLPFWRISGWCLGFFPTLLGGESVLFLTVEAVETFVEAHYQEQIYPLQCSGRFPELLKLLRHCCEEEVHHKEDAQARWLQGRGFGEVEDRPRLARLWAWVVGAGSRAAVAVCRKI
ncbi:hypothetical protein NSK_002742 [Nannochloropsis salina CCMP1776]|uniref:Ubiquinone biosynthesis protein COQ7 n=1 Tax=Nannochloropsis salina CCMP1776 TaxID=1027361 RepID=A0A4D9D310_9STRA|nr:hypothetical protein NSK_002742 [Nannochloropsis salina CCMP1776]|eukprot:TFJ85922.1 hypothetical protein NSK_002742 [Nannochloropsis salina CCMP1776]